VLPCFEGGLRHGELGAVLAGVTRLSMIASRRLRRKALARSARRCAAGAAKLNPLISARRRRRRAGASQRCHQNRCQCGAPAGIEAPRRNPLDGIVFRFDEFAAEKFDLRTLSRMGAFILRG